MASRANASRGRPRTTRTAARPCWQTASAFSFAVDWNNCGAWSYNASARSLSLSLSLSLSR
ncbi:hypothetical protein AOZ06_23785 [Kibdelosporangium phytohabitans]|uniref:Uncharacterized protein n=1 Tax=Kibdelosporangium phytohabitans TaxID=860235 RepID=A0A0N9I4N7_9PSEU|nr:hypothetical protein AOZ06_23785 [Kibdelosporangium phytohabitans]